VLRRPFVLACAGTACSGIASARPCAGPDLGRLSGLPLDGALREFRDLAAAAAGLPLTERLVFVNTAINRRVDYASDAEQFGADVWLTPLETLALGRGDCEDMAIAKFFVLLAADTPPDSLRLLYAIRRSPQTPGCAEPHLLALARQPFVDPLALDVINLNPLLVPLSWRDDLEPVLSFDCHRLWAGVQGTVRDDAAARLHRWRDLLQRIDAQRAG